MTARPSLDDYIDVAERIAEFDKRYPEGSLQTLGWSVETVGDQTFVVYRAAAYRNPDDPRPGHGIAWEPFPGRTPYTKDSELMNAETAAWGRAIVACGMTSNRKIASRQEVKARQNGDSERPAPVAEKPNPTERIATAKQRSLIFAKAGRMPASLLANIVLTSMGQDARDFDSQDAAQAWLKRALDRLPAGKVDTILAKIEAEVLA